MRDQFYDFTKVWGRKLVKKIKNDVYKNKKESYYEIKGE